MQSKTLRESLSPVIKELTNSIDHWSEVAVRQDSVLPQEHLYYHKLVKVMEDLKLFIIEQERYTNEELRLPSRANGRLHRRMDDGMEDSGIEYFG